MLRSRPSSRLRKNRRAAQQKSADSEPNRLIPPVVASQYRVSARAFQLSRRSGSARKFRWFQGHWMATVTLQVAESSPRDAIDPAN
jgi:hypothetical protein